MEFDLKIDDKKCIHCGLCIKDCMTKVFEFDENKIPRIKDSKEKVCMKCQHCLSVCPTGALSIFKKSPEDSTEYKNEFNSEEILELIKERKSIRHYKHKSIDKEVITKLKSMLRYVPTGVNNHSLHFSIVEDVEVMDLLRKKVSEKLIELISKDKQAARSFIRYLRQIKKGEDVIFRNAPHLIIVSNHKEAPCKTIDPIIALSYFELYAKSLGIGTCWSGLAYYCLTLLPEIREIVKIPETHEVGYAMVFGYPEFKYKRATQPDEYKIDTITEVK